MLVEVELTGPLLISGFVFWRCAPQKLFSHSVYSTVITHKRQVVEAFVIRSEAIANRLETIATRLEASANRLEAIAIGAHRYQVGGHCFQVGGQHYQAGCHGYYSRLEAIASRLEAICYSMIIHYVIVIFCMQLEYDHLSPFPFTVKTRTDNVQYSKSSANFTNSSLTVGCRPWCHCYQVGGRATVVCWMPLSLGWRPLLLL